MNGPPASVQYLNHYELNAKLIDLAANQQQHQQLQQPPPQQQQQQQSTVAGQQQTIYSYYSEIIPSPIVYATTAAPQPIVFSGTPHEWSFIHSNSPIAAAPHHFITAAPPHSLPPPSPQQLPPHAPLPHTPTPSLVMSHVLALFFFILFNHSTNTKKYKNILKLDYMNHLFMTTEMKSKNS